MNNVETNKIHLHLFNLYTVDFSILSVARNAAWMNSPISLFITLLVRRERLKEEEKRASLQTQVFFSI